MIALPNTIAEFRLASAIPAVAAVFEGPAEEVGARNVAAFDEFALRQRVMGDVTQRDLSVDLLGERISFPVMLTPSSGHRRYNPDGELATVRAAAAAGTLFAPAMATDFNLEEIAAAASGPVWFQTYVLENREVVAVLVRLRRRRATRRS